MCVFLLALFYTFPTRVPTLEMSVSMWEAPRKEVTISKTSSSNRDNSRGSSIWSGWRNFDLLPEEVFRPSLGSASCPSRLPPQPSALPADHWQQAFPKAELSSSLDSLSQSSSSAESSANSSPERTSAAPWTQRPVGYERVGVECLIFFS